MAGIPNLRQINARRRAQQFVGRAAQILAFTNNLALPVDQRRYVWNLQGQGGVGKTTLLKRLLGLASDAGAMIAFTDESAGDVLEVMAAISRELKMQGAPLKGFDERHHRLLELLKQVQGDPDLPDGLPALLGRTLGRVGVEAARQLPFGGSAIGLIGADNIVSKFGEYATFLTKKLKSNDDVALTLKPIDILTPIFVADMCECCVDRIVAIGFDTYEKTSVYLDSWLRALLEGRFGDLSANAIILIAGRDKLGDRWAEFLELLHTELLDPITEDEARTLLRSKGITDTETSDLIIRLSGRIPLWLATLASQSPKNPRSVQDPASNAVERFLKWVNDDGQRRAALICALPRRVDIDTVALLCGHETSRNIFDWLRAQPFVESKGHTGWVYHDVVRKMMLRHLRATSHSEWKQLNLLLAEYYDKSSAAESKLVTTHARFGLDELAAYHRLIVSPDRELKAVLRMFLNLLSIDRSRAGIVGELVEESGDLLEDAELIDWGKQMQGAVAVYYTDQWLSAIKFYDRIKEDFRGQEEYIAIAAAEKGKAHSWLNRHEDALIEYTHAIHSLPTDARLYELRGREYEKLNRSAEAISDFRTATQISPANSRLYRRLASALAGTAAFDEAIDAYTKAIEHASSPAWYFTDRAHIFEELHLYDKALEDFDAALAADPRHFRYGFRSELLARLKRYDEALRDLGQAITLRDAEEGDKRSDQRPSFRAGDEVRFIGSSDYEGQMGLIYLQMKDNERALTAFVKASAWRHNAAFYMWQAAKLFQSMERNEEAVAERKRAEVALTEEIAVVGSRSHLLALRAEIYAESGRAEESLVDYNEALRLSPENVDMLVARGGLLYKLGRCDIALCDLSAALRLDPSNSVALQHRINLFTDLGRYEEAIADIDRGFLSEDFDRTSLLAAKGLRLGYLGHYSAACDQFEQIGLNDPAIAYHHAIAKARCQGGNAARSEIESVRLKLSLLLDGENKAWAHYFSAGLYAVEENTEQAAKELAQALKSWPNGMEECDFQDRVMRDPAWLHLRHTENVRVLLAVG